MSVKSDKELKRFCLEFRDGILGSRSSESMCFALSGRLRSLLNSIYGVETELIEGIVKTCVYVSNHFWLQLADGRILDPTADQFNDALKKKMPKIYLGEKPDWYLLSPPPK